jgi:hypothetical protein
MPNSLPAVLPAEIGDPTEFFRAALIKIWTISKLVFGAAAKGFND